MNKLPEHWLRPKPQLVRQLAQRLPRIEDSLSTVTPERADKWLNGAHNALFVVTPTLLRILEDLLAKCRAHFWDTYPTRSNFSIGIHAKKSPLDEYGPLIWLTGLAGVGKSALVEAFCRTLRGMCPMTEQYDSLGGFGVVPAWHLVIEDRKSELEVLQTMFELGMELDYEARCVEETMRVKPSFPKGVPELLQMIRRRVYRDHVACLMFSEFQFLTMSATANARITGLLLNLRKLGVPCVIDGNYSLGRRVLRRNQEDKARLFREPKIILRPALPDSEDWFQTVQGFVDVSPDIFAPDVSQAAEEIHGLCAGVNRYLGELIRCAYRRARAENKRIDVPRLTAAFRSADFSEQRTEIVEIRNIAEGKRSRRKDLICPFEIPEEEVVIRKKAAEKDRLERVVSQFAQQTLTPKERAIVSDLETAKSARSGIKRSSVASIRKKSNVISLEVLRDAERQRLDRE